LSNAFEDEGSVLQDLTILESQDGNSRRSEPGVTSAIAKRRWKVPCAIRFDDEALLLAKEVHDERSERLLPAELRALEFPSTQPSPKDSLRGCLGAT